MTLPLETTLVGQSRAMVELRAIIERAAPTDLPVLIEGPTGSGKELVAAALHARSGRTGQFVAFNVCAVSESMFEDALFGHVRGAFTGAVSERPGFLREADGGTVFLDEIGGLALPLQAKLLRALETGRFRPVGGLKDVEVRTRVVAATNEPIAELVRTQRFRSDLAHRLMAAVIRVPGLEDRREDIPLLVRHFLVCAGRGECAVEPAGMKRLSECLWNGNVRELRQVVSWALALGDGAIADAAVVLAMVNRIDEQSESASSHSQRDELREVLARHSWNTDSAARELGVHRATLYRWMKRLSLQVPARSIRTDSRRVARTDANEREYDQGIISINAYRALG